MGRAFLFKAELIQCLASTEPCYNRGRGVNSRVPRAPIGRSLFRSTPFTVVMGLPARGGPGRVCIGCSLETERFYPMTLNSSEELNAIGVASPS